ncbi:MAG: hypothetical protein IPP74_06870 [Alphaproteobacteria bacterium]|nr:hypothetical protein [Alphaproteobacteria bacterium]
MLQAIIFGLNQGNNYIPLLPKSNSDYEKSAALNNSQPYEAAAYTIQNQIGADIYNWIFPKPSPKKYP